MSDDLQPLPSQSASSPTGGVSPITGFAPPIEHRFKPGNPGGPGRRSAGLTLREHINELAMSDPSESELRKIAKDKKLPWTRRTAAIRILRTLEMPDLADFQDAVDGTCDLKKLRELGLNTEVVKKMKTKTRTMPGQHGDEPTVEVERELELHDRSGSDFDRVFDRTEGKPHQYVAVEQSVTGIALVQIEVLGLPDVCQ